MRVSGMSWERMFRERVRGSWFDRTLQPAWALAVGALVAERTREEDFVPLMSFMPRSLLHSDTIS